MKRGFSRRPIGLACVHVNAACTDCEPPVRRNVLQHHSAMKGWSSLLFFLLAFRTLESLCPPAGDIFPCECTSSPTVGVRCDGMSSLESVQVALGHHFEPSLPGLQLTNFYSFSLPPHALGDLSPKKLYLRGSNIRSIDADAFEGQGGLQLLALAEDRLEDVPTEALQRLTGLRTLSLTGNFLMRVRRESFRALDALRFLFLSDNRISAVEREAFPTRLKTLSLSRNLLTTLNDSLHHLGDLEDLYLRDNRLTTVGNQLEALKNLKTLYLDRNQLTEVPKDVRHLTSLTFLSLSGNRLQSLKGSDVSSLRFLNASHNYIGELGGEVFQDLTELEVLDLSGNYLKSVCPALKHLRRLRELRLSDNHLRRLDPPCFWNAKHLRRVDLSHNQLTSVDALLQQPLPHLAGLYLHHNHLTSLPFGLRAAKSLRELDVGENRLVSFKFQHLSSSKDLALVRMGGNPWRCKDLLLSKLDSLRQRGVIIEGYPEC